MMLRSRKVNKILTTCIYDSIRKNKLNNFANRLSQKSLSLSTWSESQKYNSNVVRKELRLITQQLDLTGNILDTSSGSINVNFLNILCNVLKSDNNEHLQLLNSLNIPFKYYMNCDIHVNEDQGDDIESAYKQFLNSIIKFNNNTNNNNSSIGNTDLNNKLSDNANGILKLAIVLGCRLRQYESLHYFLKQLFTDIFEHQKSAVVGLNTFENVTHMLRRVEEKSLQKFIPVWIHTSMMEILMTQYLPLQERINSGRLTNEGTEIKSSSKLTPPIKSYATPKQTMQLLKVYWVLARRIDHNLEKVQNVVAPNESIEMHFAAFSTTATANVQNGLKPLSDILIAIQMAHEDDECKSILSAETYQGFKLRLLETICMNMELDLEVSPDRHGHHVIYIPEHVPPLKGPISLKDVLASLKEKPRGFLREPSYWAIFKGYLNRLPDLTLQRAVTSSLVSFRNTEACVGFGLLFAEQAFDPRVIQMERQRKHNEYQLKKQNRYKNTSQSDKSSDLARLMSKTQHPLFQQVQKIINSLWSMANKEKDMQGLMLVLSLSIELNSHSKIRQQWLLRALEFVRRNHVSEEWLNSLLDLFDKHRTDNDTLSLRLLHETAPFLVTKKPKAESTWKIFQQLAYKLRYCRHEIDQRIDRMLIITALSQLLLTTIVTSEETDEISINGVVDIPFSMATPLYESPHYLLLENQCLNRLKKNLRITRNSYGSIAEPLRYFSAKKKNASQQELRNDIQNDLYELFSTTDLVKYINTIPSHTRDSITLTIVYTSFCLSYYDQDLDRAFDLMYLWADAVKTNEFRNLKEDEKEEMK